MLVTVAEGALPVAVNAEVDVEVEEEFNQLVAVKELLENHSCSMPKPPTNCWYSVRTGVFTRSPAPTCRAGAAWANLCVL